MDTLQTGLCILASLCVSSHKQSWSLSWYSEVLCTKALYLTPLQPTATALLLSRELVWDWPNFKAGGFSVEKL